jgi:hypothetical protein
MYDLIQKFWMALAIGLGIMAFAGIIFMSYQVFVMGEVAQFAIG